MQKFDQTMAEEEEALGESKTDHEWRQKQQQKQCDYSSIVVDLQTRTNGKKTPNRMEVFPAGIAGKPFGFLPPDFKSLDVKTKTETTVDETLKPKQLSQPMCPSSPLPKNTSMKISNSEQKLPPVENTFCDTNKTTEKTEPKQEDKPCSPTVDELQKKTMCTDEKVIKTEQAVSSNGCVTPSKKRKHLDFDSPCSTKKKKIAEFTPNKKSHKIEGKD